MNQPIEIRDYDGTWPGQFDALAGRVCARLGNLVRRVEHVDGTAVPGLPAKDIIDLDVVVASAADLSPAITRLTEMGYTHEGDLSISGRHAFVWPPSEPRHHLYLLTEGAEELRRHVAFRDALRADRALRDRYGIPKRELAGRCSGDHDAYTRGKADFIEMALGQISAPYCSLRRSAARSSRSQQCPRLSESSHWRGGILVSWQPARGTTEPADA